MDSMDREFPLIKKLIITGNFILKLVPIMNIPNKINDLEENLSLWSA